MPHKFNDNAGRAWSLEVTVATIRRVKTLLGVNLLESVSGDLMDRMAADPALLADVVFAVVQPQAEKLGVTDAQFGEGLAGDAVSGASDALIGALVDFFPAAKRGILQRATDARKELGEAIIAKAAERLDQALAQARQELSIPSASNA